MKNFIIKLLDLKEEDIDQIDIVQQTGSFDFYVTLKPNMQICPRCGCFTKSIKGYKVRKLKHKILINFDSIIYYQQRRYICKDCGKTFNEHSSFTGNRHSMTPTTIINILNDLKPYTSTFSSIARKYGVSVTTVIDIFDKHVQIPKKKITSIMCFDEFYFNRHLKKKYAFIMLDFTKKYIIGLSTLFRTVF